MNSIIWNGVASTTIQGLLICELPPITKPEMRIKETVIDGKDGSTVEELGYSSYVKTVRIGLHGNFDINKVIKYFTGEGDIVFSNEPDKVYKAKICGKIDYTRLLRYRQASIPFLVQPFKYKLNEYLMETPTETVSGTSILVSDREDDILKSFKIYGKSTQNGTPTPDAPVNIVSIGDDGGITVSTTDGTEGNIQSFVVQTPNGLHGIPVSTGGNYTDANGQQWICNEIDLVRGKFITRIAKQTISNIKTFRETSDYAGRYVCDGFLSGYYKTGREIALSNFARWGDWGVGSLGDARFAISGRNLYYYPANAMTVAEINTLFAEIISSETPTIVLAQLATPIETELTEEELATYKALLSSKPTATILNDENAYMMVEYFKPFEVFNEGLENSKPLMVLKGSGTVEISVNGVGVFSYTFPDGENEVYIDSEKEDAYLGTELKNRNMNGEFPILIPKTNKIEWSGDIESISILPRSRWL